MSSTTAGRASAAAVPDSIGLPRVRGYWGTVGYRLRYDYVTMIEGLGGTATNLKALDVSDVTTDSADYPQ